MVSQIYKRRADLHPGHNLRERREAARVQATIVLEIYEQLRRPRVWSCRGKAHKPSCVALYYRIIFDDLVLPLRCRSRVARDAKLRLEQGIFSLCGGEGSRGCERTSRYDRRGGEQGGIEP